MLRAIWDPPFRESTAGQAINIDLPAGGRFTEYVWQERCAWNTITDRITVTATECKDGAMLKRR